MLGRNARNLGNDVLDLRDIDAFHSAVGRLQALIGAASSITSMALSGMCRSLM